LHALQPEPVTRPPAPVDLQRVSGYEVLRRRYLRAGLWISACINLLATLDAEAPAAVQAIRLSVVAGSLGCLWALRRGGDALRLGKLVALGLPAGALAGSLWQAPAGWPVGLAYLPLLVVFGALVGGSRIAAIVTGVAVALVSAAYALPGVPSPPYLASQVTSWVVAVVTVTLFVRRLSRILAAGAAELAASAEALIAAQRDAAAVALMLSSRVARAVDDLARALDESPDRAGPAAEEVSTALRESRRAVPLEPALPEAALGAQLAAFDRRAMDWTILLLAVAFTLLTARTAVWGPRENLPYNLGPLLTALAVGGLRGLRPAWRPALDLAFWMLMFGFGAGILWGWFARAPIPPPSLVLVLASSVFISATLSPVAALVTLTATTVICLAALRLHPGIPWTAPVNLAAAYAMLSWMVWRWPRDLLAALTERRDAASAQIRKRRRLVATLFHDLANPLAVILADMADRAQGTATPDWLDRSRAMARRLQQTLAAALSGGVTATEVDAGQISDELVQLFRDRLRGKRLALRLTGPPSARLRCDVALLRDSVLANLFSNALKFSPEGGSIDLTVRTAKDRVALVIEDRGPGLPPEVLAAFARGDNLPTRPGTRGEQGTGFGLVLARHYLAAMGGALELLPRAGGGLSACVWLPAAEADRGPAGADGAGGSGGSWAPGTAGPADHRP